MNPFDIVTEFENAVAEYTGAPYAVAVDSCTNALFLCFKRYEIDCGGDIVMLPKRTYVGVAQAAINAGHKICFVDYNWTGSYYIALIENGPYMIIDSAKQLRKYMFCPHINSNVDMCLSFHWQKHLPIGKGGMILTDSKERADLYRRMRYDGRTAGVAPKDDTFIRGYHCFMDPKDAAQGLLLMQYIPDYNEDLPCDDYPDLSKQEIFK